MDAVFSFLNEADRTNYVRSLMHSFRCTYICIWSYLPQPNNHLYYLDGHYNEESNQTSGSLARKLFDGYRREVFLVLNDHIPGIAFIYNQTYRELNQSQLLALASVEVQRQFYQEARIKTAVFMSCRRGEIEMGWSNANQINMEHAMMSWFSEYNIQSQVLEVSQALHHNRPSSSSSSLNSPDSSSFKFNVPTTSNIPALLMQSLQQLPTTTTSPLQQSMQAFAFSRNVHLPPQETEDEAMTRAIIAVLTSPSSSSSSSTSSSTPNLPYTHHHHTSSAFNSYLAPTTPTTPNIRTQSLLKRSITYYRSLNIVRREQMMANRPTTTQLHHMISERRRREKINESFEALRKLLPPEPKKDKASVLSRTRDYLTLLTTQVKELSQRNQQLEAQLLALPLPKPNSQLQSSNQTLDVRITNVSESTSEEERIINLLVVLSGECPVSNLVIRILEFLKQVNNVSLMSVEANTSRIILTLRILGNEWDEAAFQEAVRRIVADLAQ